MEYVQKSGRAGGVEMSAFNVVRFRVKPGREQDFVSAHEQIQPDLPGMRKFSLVKTGDRNFCIIGEWESMESIVNARPMMIGALDSMRDMLEDLGGGLG